MVTVTNGFKVIVYCFIMACLSVFALGVLQEERQILFASHELWFTGFLFACVAFALFHLIQMLLVWAVEVAANLTGGIFMLTLPVVMLASPGLSCMLLSSEYTWTLVYPVSPLFWTLSVGIALIEGGLHQKLFFNS